MLLQHLEALRHCFGMVRHKIETLKQSRGALRPRRDKLRQIFRSSRDLQDSCANVSLQCRDVSLRRVGVSLRRDKTSLCCDNSEGDATYRRDDAAKEAVLRQSPCESAEGRWRSVRSRLRYGTEPSWERGRPARALPPGLGAEIELHVSMPGDVPRSRFSSALEPCRARWRGPGGTLNPNERGRDARIRCREARRRSRRERRSSSGASTRT